jgi:hypothetical protein
MKITLKIIVLIFLFFGFIFLSCKKYPEGPCISFRSAAKRFYGTYTLTAYIVDGVDSLSLYNDSLGNSFYFSYNDIYSYNNLRINGNRTDGKWGGDIDCRWELKEKNKIFSIYNSYGLHGIGPFGEGKKSDWEIIRLTNNESKMKTLFNGNEYIIRLEE